MTPAFAPWSGASLSLALPDADSTARIRPKCSCRIERPGKPPGLWSSTRSKDERSLPAWLARLTSEESVNDQHVVVLSEQRLCRRADQSGSDVWIAAEAVSGRFRRQVSARQSRAERWWRAPKRKKSCHRRKKPKKSLQAESAKLSRKKRQIDRFEERLTAQSPVATFVAGLLRCSTGCLFNGPLTVSAWTQLQESACRRCFVSDGEPGGL